MLVSGCKQKTTVVFLTSTTILGHSDVDVPTPPLVSWQKIAIPRPRVMEDVVVFCFIKEVLYLQTVRSQ